MKVIETVTRLVTEQKVTGTLCDICNKPANLNPDTGLYYGSYDAHEITILIKTGSSYPDSGSGEEYAPDICMKCAKEKVIPALEALGCKARWTDWDW